MPSRSRRSRLAPALLVIAVGLTASPAWADEAPLSYEAYLPARVTRQEHPFAFTADPSTPSAGVLAAGYAFGVGSGIGADRPLPVSLATANGSHTVEVAYGLTGSLAPFARATLADVGAASNTQSVMAGLTWQVSRPGARSRLSLSAAGMHEGASGANGVTALVAGSVDQGPLRVAANLRGDKVFAAGRDRLDYLVTLGASWRLASVLRIGAEYVGQDLEETFAAEAEGGARHAAGPTLALDLDGGRYQLALGAGFGLTARSPRALARAAVAFAF